MVPSTPAPVVKAQTAGVTAATGIEGVNLRGEDDDDDDEDEAVRKELARWRSNARNRVKNGRAPRTFTSDVMPDSIHDAVMKHLGSATTRAEVDSAFETVVLPKDRRVTKAVSSDPSAFQWPGHRFDQRLAAHYADQLLKALQDTRGITEAQAAARAALGGSDIESMAVAAAQLATDQNLTFDTDSLVSILRGIYADSYLAGTHAATMAVGQAGHVLASFAGLDSGIDWAKWEPGYAAAAEQVRDGGLEKLLAAADLRVKGIIGSTLSDLGNVLAKGLLNGDSVQTIGRAMRDIVADPNRAFLIANTETARSLGAATLATYTANGVTGKRWLTFQPCDICEANESQGVIATGDSFDSGDAVPPAHPRCRCAVAPARLIEGA